MSGKKAKAERKEHVKCAVCLCEMDEHAADDGPVHLITGRDSPSGIRYAGFVHDRCMIVLNRGGKEAWEARTRMVEWSK